MRCTKKLNNSKDCGYITVWIGSELELKLLVYFNLINRSILCCFNSISVFSLTLSKGKLDWIAKNIKSKTTQ